MDYLSVILPLLSFLLVILLMPRGPTYMILPSPGISDDRPYPIPGSFPPDQPTSQIRPLTHQQMAMCIERVAGVVRAFVHDEFLRNRFIFTTTLLQNGLNCPM